MKKLVSALAIGGAAVLAAAPVAAQNVQDLLKKHACLSCHAVDKKLVGPSYKDVAAKYRGQADAEAKLAAKVKKGGQACGARSRCPRIPTCPTAT